MQHGVNWRPLAAAINYHVKDMVGGVQTLFRPTLPDAPEPRQRWLTRSEAARLIWAAWRKRGSYNGVEKGRLTSRHIARFILVGLYTGTRASAICSATLIPTIGRGHINLETGQFRRLAYGKQRERQAAADHRPAATTAGAYSPLAPAWASRSRRWSSIRAHLLFASPPDGMPWSRRPGSRPTSRSRRCFGTPCGIPPIRWFLHSGVPPHQVSDYCGVASPIIKKVYKHHITGGSTFCWPRGGLAGPQQLRNRNRSNGREQNATGCNK